MGLTTQKPLEGTTSCKVYTTVLNEDLNSCRPHWGDPRLRTFDHGPKGSYNGVHGKKTRQKGRIKGTLFKIGNLYCYTTQDTRKDRLVTWTLTRSPGGRVFGWIDSGETVVHSLGSVDFPTLTDLVVSSPSNRPCSLCPPRKLSGRIPPPYLLVKS